MEPLQVRPGCWMVGHRNPRSLLQCNTYIRSFESGSKSVHVCIDPGSAFDVDMIESNIQQLIGDLSEIHTFTLNHQDPDVVANAPRLCAANPRVDVLVTEEVWRLVQHLGFKPGRVQLASPASSHFATIGKNQRLQLIPTPFCHFRGAMAFYDPEIRTLFSGDLFGGLNQLGRVHLLADENDWAGVAQFHQIYMPTREALRYAVQQIRAIRPVVEVIAPQHGHIITGDLVPLCLERMHDLLVGIDLLAMELDNTHLHGYQRVLDGLVDTANELLGPHEVRRLLNSHVPGDGLERLLDFDGTHYCLQKEGYTAIAKVVARLLLGESAEFANQVRAVVLAACTIENVPIPAIGAGIEGAPQQGPMGNEDTT